MSLIPIAGATASSHEDHGPIMGATHSGMDLTMPTPPVVVTAPYVGGDGTPGSTLSCTQGTWENEPTSYTYQWQSDSLVNVGTNDANYTPTYNDLGHALTCVVKATNSSGYAMSRSNGVAIIDGSSEAQSTPPLTRPE